MNRLVAESVSYGFGPGSHRRPVLNRVSLSVSEGEFVAIGGVNGAGKSTLLRLLAGDVVPSAGRVLWNGVEVSAIPPEELARSRACLTQQTHCALPFIALEVVAMGAEVAGEGGVRALQLARASMRLSGTEHLAGRAMDQLSGGEAQRVHWARVLAQLGGNWKGKCLLLDEPVSSLDLAFQHEMLAVARKVAAAGGIVVAVLHDLNLMAEYADRVCFLHQGQVICDGTPRKVFTERVLETVYGIRARVVCHPVHGGPLVLAERPA
mgnify:CR=1 FL=1